MFLYMHMIKLALFKKYNIQTHHNTKHLQVEARVRIRIRTKNLTIFFVIYPFSYSGSMYSDYWVCQPTVPSILMEILKGTNIT